MGNNKQKALDVALENIKKQFGDGAIMKLGGTEVQKIPVISTGILTLDIALGVGGIPRGRITEIYGAESSSKTTLALHVTAQAQKNGGVAAFIDAEHAMDITYAESMGVDIENLLISQPDSGENALEILEHLVRSGAIDLIVLDSVAALTPRAELEGDMGDAHVGLQARLMSQALRKLTSSISKTSTAVIFINQTRSKIGQLYGNPMTTSGGNALKFYSTVRIELAKKETLKRSKDEAYGIKVRASTVKNKVAPPMRKITYDLIFGKGVVAESCIVDVATDLNIITKAGSWFSYNDDKIGQGRDNVIKFLIENPSLSNEIETLIYKQLDITLPERLKGKTKKQKKIIKE